MNETRRVTFKDSVSVSLPVDVDGVFYPQDDEALKHTSSGCYNCTKANLHSDLFLWYAEYYHVVHYNRTEEVQRKKSSLCALFLFNRGLFGREMMQSVDRKGFSPRWLKNTMHQIMVNCRTDFVSLAGTFKKAPLWFRDPKLFGVTFS